MREESIELLRELSEAHGVPGYEDEVRAIFVNELEDVGEFSTDGLGSVFCEVAGDGPRVMIAGHMDEVGFRVQNITPDGFLQFVPLGGWWEHTLLAQRVEILTRSGIKLPGVIASRPPHFLPEAQRRQLMSIDDMFIDVGAVSRREVEERMGIALGDPIAPWSPFTQLGRNDWLMGKAFDNRAGMAATIQAGLRLASGPRENTLILAGTVQEEVGLRGAKTAAVKMAPDVVIVLEGPPADDTPGFNRTESQGRLGGGAQIRMQDPSAVMSPRLVELAIRVAQEEGIPYQVTVRRSGGTDAGSFHVSGEGVPCIVIGVPARYIHSHNAIIDLNDFQHCVELTVALARRLDGPTVAGLTRFF